MNRIQLPRHLARATTPFAVVFVLLFTVSAALVMSPTALAQTADGTGPDSALSPTGEQVTLEANEWRWYTFEYGSDGDGDTEPEEAIAELQMNEPGAIDFEVWTQDDVRRWRNGEDFAPTGAGTAAFAAEDDDSDNRDRTMLRWVGAGEAAVTYYIVVQNQTDGPASYSLNVMGPTVSFTAVGDSTLDEAESTDADTGATDTMTDTTGTDTTDATATTSDSDRASDETDMRMMAAGTGPDSAMTPSGSRMTIAPGERAWYIFRYVADEDDSDPDEAVVELQMSRAGAIDFEVWTQDDVRRWRNREDFSPTGAGTPAFALGEGDSDDRNRSLLRWVGAGQGTVDYYIVVENNSDQAASYRLRVMGSPVAFLDTATMMDSADMMDSSAMTDTATMTDTAMMTDTTMMTDTMASEDNAMMGGTGPDNALNTSPGARTLGANETRWYTFEYTADGDASTDPDEAVVELRMSQPGALDFEVWTEDQVDLWRDGIDFTPTGRGTAAFAIEDDEDSDNRDRSLLRWVGSGEETVRYYVLVENNTDSTVTYRLRIMGFSVNP